MPEVSVFVLSYLFHKNPCSVTTTTHSHFTFNFQPDLVSMGDGCVIDCASIVCHLNTRGSFQLAKIVMEDQCTLRTRSRLQQGVYMESGSQLLEKSLAMTGEVIEANSVWQGGPAAWWFQYSNNSVPYANDDDSIDTYSIVDESSSLLKSKASYSYGAKV